MAADTPPPPPSETVRAGVTVVLGLYLVGLVLCVAGNSGSGASALVRTVKSKLFSPWMTLPWLDLGYDTRLTHGFKEDCDHSFEIRRLDAPDASEAMILPGRTMHGERAARWRRLARATAVGEADPEREGLLPAAVGQGALVRLSSRDVSLRVMRQLPPDRRDVVDGLADVAGQREQAYAARVRVVDDDLQLITSTPREELAPLLEDAVP